MEIRESNEPIIEPCGTPVKISLVAEVSYSIKQIFNKLFRPLNHIVDCKSIFLVLGIC